MSEAERKIALSYQIHVSNMLNHENKIFLKEAKFAQL